jgi:hypothetical protein
VDRHGSGSPQDTPSLGAPLIGFAGGFSVFSLGGLSAAWLNQHDIHGLLAFIDYVVMGVVVGIVVLFYELRRRRDIEKKLQTIRLMNHHVRNALQVVSFASSSLDAKDPRAAPVRDAVKRIEWALREVLPGEGHHTHFDAPSE